jgi:hypothetical protein
MVDEVTELLVVRDGATRLEADDRGKVVLALNTIFGLRHRMRAHI